MSERESYPTGVPCWITCLAPDVHEAMAFYSEVFGWTYKTDQQVTYAVAILRGREVAGIGSLAQAGPDAQPSWITEVCVDSADAAAERSSAAGGQLLAGPLDMPPAGRLAVLADPSGAVICAFEPDARRGAQLVNEPGAWSMSALSTPDPDAAARFYGAMFGWEREEFGPMTMWRRPGYVGGEPSQPVPRDVVAVMSPPAESPAQWGVDLWVEDAGVAAAAAVRAGGAILSPPERLEGLPFRSAVLADPAGAVFRISQLLTD